jgi:hypothetical protein
MELHFILMFTQENTQEVVILTIMNTLDLGGRHPSIQSVLTDEQIALVVNRPENAL